MFSPSTSLRSSLFTQKVYPSFSITVSSSKGSSRASAKRGPRQPPGARYIRIGCLSFPSKNAASSCRAFSDMSIMLFLQMISPRLIYCVNIYKKMYIQNKFRKFILNYQAIYKHNFTIRQGLSHYEKKYLMSNMSK